MEENRKYITVIDFGTSKIRTAIGIKDDELIEVIEYSEFPTSGISRGEIVNLQKVVEPLISTITDIEEDSKYKINEIYANVACQNFKVLDDTITSIRKRPDSYITESEIQDNLNTIYLNKHEGRDKIYFISSQYYNIDETQGVKEEDVIGMTGKSLELWYKVIIGNGIPISSIKGAIKKANLNAKKLFFRPVATTAAIVSEEEKEIGVATIDMGKGTTDLIIYENNILKHACTFPFGGDTINKDICEICGLSNNNAESLKTQIGSCISEYAQEGKYINVTLKDGNVKQISYKLLLEVIEARVLEIFMSIKNEIDKYSNIKNLKGGVVLTGGCSNLTHIQILAKKILGLEVRFGKASLEFFSYKSRSEIFDVSASSVAGLLCMAFNDISSENNILPEETSASTEENLEKKDSPKKNKGNFIKSVIKEINSFFNTDDNNA